MSIAALAAWFITVVVGGFLLAAGVSNGHRQAAEAGAVAAGAGGAARTDEMAAASAEMATGHPLLEFCHPALAVIGLMFWIFFVVSDHFSFAWIAFGALAATALLGITWLVSGFERRRRARVPPGPVFPRKLVLLHGVAVICTFTLVLIAAVGHG